MDAGAFSKVLIMIELINVSKSFGSQKVLRGVNLKIPEDSITVILGRSGEGKTILLKHMIGLIKPDSGTVLVDGEDLNHLSDEKLLAVRKKFGMLFQHAALFDSLTVEENVAFPIKEHSKKSAKEIHELVMQKLELVGLKNVEHKMPSQLSGGMRKRVGLARALALSPKIILYDEPTTGLDPLMTDSVNELIHQTQKKLHVTSIIISHDIESTFRIADQVAMLHEGQIIECGSPEVFQQSKNPIVQHFIQPKKRLS